MLENDAVLRRDGARRACRSACRVSGTGQPETLDRAVSLGIFSAVQATWNLHERAAGPALAAAHAAGLKVIVKEGLANGRLAGPRRRGAGRRCSPSRGRTSCCRGAATSTRCAPTCAPATCRAPGELPELIEDSAAYWRHRSDLPWN